MNDQEREEIEEMHSMTGLSSDNYVRKSKLRELVAEWREYADVSRNPMHQTVYANVADDLEAVLDDD